MSGTSWCLAPVLALLAAGCASSGGTEAAPAAHAAAEHAGECTDCAECPLMAVREAVAAMHPTHGNTAHGWVRFVDTGAGVRVTAEIGGLTPNAKHAFHIHEFGDGTSADGASAGGHYNPEGHPHAAPEAAERHAGDLGNLETDAQGVARYDRTLTGISIAGMENPILGRGVIVHAKVDDFSQPVGNAGARIACGVIGVAKAAAK